MSEEQEKQNEKQEPQQPEQQPQGEAAQIPNAQIPDAGKIQESREIESPPETESASENVGQEDSSSAAPDFKKKRRPSKPSFSRKKEEDSGFIEKVISINRITKVTKGGKKLSFSALVVVGDGKGHVGYCLDKAPEVATAIQKSLRIAKKNMFKVSVRKGTISHEIIGRCGGATVLLKPASEGTGVIAAGPVRALCDASGIRNILTKCHRSNNPINVIKATVDGLTRLKPFKGHDKEEIKEATKFSGESSSATA